MASVSSAQSSDPVSPSPVIQSFSSAPVSSSPDIDSFSDSEPSQSILAPHAPAFFPPPCLNSNVNSSVNKNGLNGLNNEGNNELNNELNSEINSDLSNNGESGGQLAPSLEIMVERKSVVHGQLAPSPKLVYLGGSDPWKGQASTPEDDDVYFECGQQVHSELSECPMTQDNVYDSNKRRHPSSDEDEMIIEVVKINCSTCFEVFSKFSIG